MACQLKDFAKIDIDDVKKQLSRTESLGSKGAIYNDSSGGHNNLGENDNLPFLQDCPLSMSPGCEILAFAHKKILCILCAKWDSYEEDEPKTKFKTTWIGNPCHDESEEITSILCLPLALPQKSSNSSLIPEQIDWTCLALGFSSGHLRFYDEGGGLLLSEQIYNEPILNLKCQSLHPSKSSSYADYYSEELYVTFRSNVAIIPGFALFQTLRACRNQLAKVKANFDEHISPPPLTLKKWAFIHHDRMRDCEIIGPSSSDMFDHLMSASIQGGFSSSYRSGAPKSILVVSAGKGPFVGFHLAQEGVEGRSVLTDVAHAVKSKFRGLFQSSKNQRKKAVATIEPPEDMNCRFGIRDVNREAYSIVKSPNSEYSAVIDGFGRVTLVNNYRGIAVRMWKGYRRAQCGWLQVKEEEPSQKGGSKLLLRTTLFLVIYEPRKGLIEVWSVPFGGRVVAFSCSKNGRLLYTCHGLMGLSSIPFKSDNRSSMPCAFLAPSGVISAIIVPFHFALSDGTSERAADLGLLRKLRSILRDSDLEDEQLAQEVGLIASELKTRDVHKQMLTMLITNKHVTVNALEAALAVFMDKASAKDSTPFDDNGRLFHLSSQLRNLIAFYKFAKFACQRRECPPKHTHVFDSLGISESEMNALKSLLLLLESPVSFQSKLQKEVRVTFSDGPLAGSSVVDYLACFDFETKEANAISSNAVAVKLLSPSKMHFLAELIFQGVMYSDVSIESWQAEAASSGILPSDLLQIAVKFWLQHSAGKAFEDEITRFSEIVKAICLLEEVNSCDLSRVWSTIREILENAHQLFNSLTAAIVCRAVACSMDKNNSKKHSKSPKKTQVITQETEDCSGLVDCVKVGPSKESPAINKDSSKREEICKTSLEWEDVSWDLVKWNLLIGRLDSLAFLDQVLGQNPSELCSLPSKTYLPCLLYERPQISLCIILQRGRGAVSEYVAKWLSTCGMNPKVLVEGPDIELMDKHTGIPDKSVPIGESEPTPEDKSEVMIREGTPLETEMGTDASTVCSAYAAILEKINLLRTYFPYSLCGSRLLSNISWEYLLEWHKCPERMEILESALTCLQIVPNIHIRYGLCSLMWSSHLKHRFEIAVNIVNECHGNPKDKLCRRELHMSENHLSEFVALCVKFFELYIEALTVIEVTHRPGPEAVVNRSEDLWDYNQSGNASVSSTPSLTALALSQPQALFHDLDILHQIAFATHMILALGLKGQQLRPLFKSSEWSVFSSNSIYAASSTVGESSKALQSFRTGFLRTALTAAMQDILSSDPSHVTDLSGGVSSDMKAVLKWIGHCQDLAHTWQLSMDPIRRHQVLLLYSSGHDRLAEEILSAINDVEQLAVDLLYVAGKRLKLHMNKSLDLMESVSNLDPSLTAWIVDMNISGARRVPLSDCASLTTRILQFLPENHPEHKFATLMHEALQALSTYNE